MTETSINKANNLATNSPLYIHTHMQKVIKPSKYINTSSHIFFLPPKNRSMRGLNNNDANVAGPSIALLQERFRQLERAREQREDKTLKLFPEAQVIKISNNNYIPSNQGLQRDQRVIFPSGTHEKDHILSLGLCLNNNNNNQIGLRVMKTQKFWPGFSPKGKFGNSDVDTSLHL